MVRVKHRYLLVQILTPSTPPRSKATATTVITNIRMDNSTLPAQPPLLLHIHSPTPDNITAPLLLSHLRQTLALLFGDQGAALAGANLLIKYWSAATSTFIIRCKRECLRLVWAAVTWCRTLPAPRGGTGKERVKAMEQENEVVMRVVRVSGTIRKCEEEAVRRARALCGRVKGVQVAVEGGISSMGKGGEVFGEDNDAGLGYDVGDPMAGEDGVSEGEELDDDVE